MSLARRKWVEMPWWLPAMWLAVVAVMTLGHLKRCVIADVAQDRKDREEDVNR